MLEIIGGIVSQAYRLRVTGTMPVSTGAAEQSASSSTKESARNLGSALITIKSRWFSMINPPFLYVVKEKRV